METEKNIKTWKQKLFREFTEFWVNAAYLALVFGVLATARRLTLSHYGIEVQDYFVGIIKALIIAKVIMIGAFLKISRKFENRPLVIPVFYKTILFVFWVMLFDFAEGFIRGYIDTGNLTDTIHFLMYKHFNKMWLGGLLFVSISFLPFFALKELARVIGYDNFRRMFLKSGK
jgi:hypothetical protein